MQLRYVKSLVPPNEAIARIAAVCYAPNGKKVAVADAFRIVHLYDEKFEKRDKFSTKPGDPKGAKSYVIRGMAFSSDSTKLAIAQSDNIVFIYKLGLDWGEKKSICNKFAQSSAVTCLCWPESRPNDIIFGLSDGKIKIGNLRTNKSMTLFGTESVVVSLCASPDGSSVLSGHADGTIQRFFFDDATSGSGFSQLVQHSCVPYALSWGQHIAAGGSDQRVVFYDTDGAVKQAFDFSDDPAEKEFTVAAFNPSGGESVIVGSFDRLRIFHYNRRRDLWESVGVKQIANLYTVTALSWRPDGSKLLVGSLCGAVDVYDACLRRVRYHGKFELMYVSRSQVIVKRLSNGNRIVLPSNFGYEITKVDIYHDRFIVAVTPSTLLVGDMQECRMSEVPWNGANVEKCLFDNEKLCMVLNAGEVSFIEYGKNEILGSCRTDYVSTHLFSVRIIPPTVSTTGEASTDEGIKRVAYLMDRQTLNIMDLNSGISLATLHVESKVDWLELNEKSNRLLFRDKRCHLHLFDVDKQVRTTLLTMCSYVQWVPGADVIVAQNRSSISVWYNMDAPDRVTMIPIRGDVVEIERADGRTSVIVDESGSGGAGSGGGAGGGASGGGNLSRVSYVLDNAMIDFGAALEAREYGRAISLLEQLEVSDETESMWMNLANHSLREFNLTIAERCYAALGDVSKARYLRKVNSLCREVTAGGVNVDAANHYAVRARMKILDRKFKEAERVYLEQGQVDDAMAMYAELHRYEESLAVAESKNHSDARVMRDRYFGWLLKSHQYAKAAELKEKGGAYKEAMQLYLQGGLPARAAHVVTTYSLAVDANTVDNIFDALSRSNMFEKAGDFLERLGQFERAIDAYQRGHAYRKAVELSRVHQPSSVVRLEREWGDWLVSQKQVDAALNHYVEAGEYTRAIEAAIESRQWTKACQYVDRQDAATAQKYFLQIAKYFEEAVKYADAERYYIRAGQARAAVDMYTRANLYDQAHAVAVAHLSESEAASLYVTQAHRLERHGKYKMAEKLYVKVGEVDLAIQMYEQHRLVDDVIRLVTQYRKDQLTEKHLKLGQQFDVDGNFRQAEHHYVQARDWRSAVNMYRLNALWDDALRVAKVHGGNEAWKQVAFAWALHLGGDEGAKILTRFGLIEQAIDYAVEQRAFPRAMELAETSLKSKVPEICIKHAMALEDEGKYAEAEAEFIRGQKPREAIDMYVHQRDWANAQRVAEQHDAAAIVDILMARGNVAAEEQDYGRAEKLFVQCKRPDLAVAMYRRIQRIPDARRVAELHCPHLLYELNSVGASGFAGDNSGPAMAPGSNMAGGGGDLQNLSVPDTVNAARQCESRGEFARAIDLYLSVTREKAANTLGLSGDGLADHLEQVWEEAVRVAMNHVQPRIANVVQVVSSRLLEIHRFEAAAELLIGIDQFKDAVDIYIRAGAFQKALAFAQNRAPHLVPSIREQMDRQTQSSQSPQQSQQQSQQLQQQSQLQQQPSGANLRSNSDRPTTAASRANSSPLGSAAGSRSSGNDSGSGGTVAFTPSMGPGAGGPGGFGAGGPAPVLSVEELADRGMWDRCLAEAVQQGPAAQRLYAALHAEAFGKQQRWVDAIRVLAQHGADSRSRFVPTLRRTIVSVISDPTTSLSVMQDVRKFLYLYTVAAGSGASGPEAGPASAAVITEFTEALNGVHILTMKETFRTIMQQEGRKNENLLRMFARSAASLLRYSKLFPVDKVFFDAGDAARRSGNLGVAFVVWNRYLDMSDAIDEGSRQPMLDSTEFNTSDVPSDVILPTDHSVQADKREEVREWILTNSLEKNFEQVLPTQSCEKCGTDVYEGSLRCCRCNHVRDMCIVTGYPAFRMNRTQCPSCRRFANKDDWTVWVNLRKRCPWCQEDVA